MTQCCVSHLLKHKKTVMKNFITTLLVLVAIGFGSAVQAQTHEKGTTLLRGSIGVNSAFPVSAAIEYGVANPVGIGAGVTFFRSAGLSVLSFSGRSLFHLNINSDKLDPYAVAIVAYTKVIGITAITGGGAVGANYYFSDKVAGSVEAGVRSGFNFNIGLTYKLR